MVRHIEAVLFDLGGTLMFARRPWPAIIERADAALVDVLAASGVKLKAAIFRKRLEAYYSVRDQELYETTYHFILREVLKDHGYDEIPEPLLRRALDAMFEVTRTNWDLRPEAVPTLRELRKDKHRLGIISNAGDDQDVQELVRRFGIREFMDFVVTSAACSYRKPHPRIFEIAIAHWILEPTNVAMVGDTFEADIVGAARLGMYTMWLVPGSEDATSQASDVVPDVRLRSLTDAIAALRGLT